MLSKIIGFCILRVFVAAALTFPLKLHAEENGTGAYIPGTIASHIDSMLPSPGWILRTNAFNFWGENNINCLDLGCSSRADIQGRSNALSVTLGWRPNIDLAGDYSYMMSVVVPYVKVDVTANVLSNTGGGAFSVSDSNEGIGDIELIPLNLSYHLDEKNDLNFKAIIRAPTGEFKATQLANLGKNYWSYEPTISWLHHDRESSLYAAVYAGINFNQTNPDTQFKSGQQVHLDFTLQQKFTYGNGQAGIGLTGYTYRQITDDSGAGVLFPGNRARVSGIGPVLSYHGMWSNRPIVFELKWTHDFDVKHRFGGDTAILKAGMIF